MEYPLTFQRYAAPVSVPSHEHVAPADRPPGPVNQGRDHRRQRPQLVIVAPAAAASDMTSTPGLTHKLGKSCFLFCPIWFLPVLPSCLLPRPISVALVNSREPLCPMLPVFFFFLKVMLPALVRNFLRVLGPYSLARPKHDKSVTIKLELLKKILRG